MTEAAPCLRHWRGWVGATEADGWLRTLLEEVPWKQESITVFGRRHAMPRLTCWMADPGCGYRYSGLENAIEPWTPLVAAIRRRVGEAARREFNSLLLNLYRDGRDAMGWHADDEAELDPEAPIASLSLGASRTLRFRPRRRGTAEALAVELGHGDLLLMDPPTQRHWQHGLPRRLKVEAPRLNLTFRVVRVPPKGAAAPAIGAPGRWRQWNRCASEGRCEGDGQFPWKPMPAAAAGAAGPDPAGQRLSGGRGQ